MGNRLQKPQEAEQPNENEPKQEQEPDFTCEICIEPTQANRKFKNSNLCSHCFCFDCISKYIEVKVEGRTGIIGCPGLSCKLPLDPLSCRPIISKPLFDKWCDYLCDTTVLGLDSCYCPYQDCSALVLNECHEKLKKIKCPNCKITSGLGVITVATLLRELMVAETSNANVELGFATNAGGGAMWDRVSTGAVEILCALWLCLQYWW